MEVKFCTTCRTEKPLSEFHRNKAAKDGAAKRCKRCACRISAEYYHANKNRPAGEKRLNYLRFHKLRSLYGVDQEAYFAMLERQGGVCAICSGPPSDGKNWLAVDHDHATGRVRGLLCNRCNLVLGRMEDNPEFLRRAADYLG